jgi:competence protein ComEC
MPTMSLFHSLRGLAGALSLAALAAGCASASPDDVAQSDDDLTIDRRITGSVVSSVAQIPHEPPAPGHYRVHMIDVGSGLAMLVQGNDFTMLFDGGSGDDSRGITKAGNKSRLLAYLFAALGPSGSDACTPQGDVWPARPDGKQLTINHVVLSHPHDDHVSMLDAVLRCYAVENVWEPGMGYNNQEYGGFLKSVVEEPGVRYHTVLPVPADRSQIVAGVNITVPPTTEWSTFEENHEEILGAKAKFKVLHVDPASHKDNANLNSLVLRVNLGRTSLLLTGDALGGERGQSLDAKPSYTEGELMARHAKDINVDILQVGHHGSSTSSRRQFIQAVSPNWALISVGPRPFTGSRLPEQNVMAMLTSMVPHVGRTDEHDALGCPEKDRVGVEDNAPGGCDNYLLEIAQ